MTAPITWVRPTFSFRRPLTIGDLFFLQAYHQELLAGREPVWEAFTTHQQDVVRELRAAWKDSRKALQDLDLQKQLQTLAKEARMDKHTYAWLRHYLLDLVRIPVSLKGSYALSLSEGKIDVLLKTPLFEDVDIQLFFFLLREPTIWMKVSEKQVPVSWGTYPLPLGDAASTLEILKSAVFWSFFVGQKD